MDRIVCALLLFFLCGSAALAERPRPLGWALEAMRTGNWEVAASLAARDGPVAADIIEWHRLRAGRGNAEQVLSFLERRPDWPGLPLMRRRSEAAIGQADDQTVLNFFSDDLPQTATGTLRHAQALVASGQSGEAQANLVLFWRTKAMGQRDHARFLSRHSDLLASHHEARLEAMLWARENENAQAMYDLVGSDYVALARAWQNTRGGAPNADALIRAVPDNLKDHPGLAHARFEWRLRKGRWAEAKDLLLAQSGSLRMLGQPEAWANRRRSLARDEMRDGEPARAYRIAAQHHLSEGSAYADLEWLSGYIALRWLDDPQTALAHFRNHRAAIRSPISRGRAGYWIGRAYQDMGNAEAAQTSYADAAQFQTTFYGLLAAEAAGLHLDVALNGNEDFGDWRDADLAKSALFQAGILLQASGDLDLAERFWTHLAESLDRTSAGQLGQAAIDLSQPHLAVMIGKRVARRGITIHGPYYPLHPLTEADLPMAAEMSLAIARRESEFDPKVQSGAGARGLMQIMPATGAEVAARLGKAQSHRTERLTQDPVYNAELGTAYLSELAGRYNGNPVLMAIAYNAGPGRADRWMDLYGDPRKLRSAHEIVDWIEHIPFRETRNYAMRVTESLPIYRARLGKEALPSPFSRELTGNSLLPFAPPRE